MCNERLSGGETSLPVGLDTSMWRVLGVLETVSIDFQSFVASLETFGRLARRCAVDARYVNSLLRVDALRRSSLEIVDGERPGRRAVSRTPTC